MAMKCDNCGRGRDIGHNVSHAKNRTWRLFKPNLQKLRVLKNGVSIRVKFCTSCIQRLKKYKKMDGFELLSYAPALSATETTVTAPSKKHIDREKKKIEEILKKEDAKHKASEEKEKASEKTKAAETKKLEELVGKK